MGHDLYEQYPLAKEIFHQADDILGFSLSETMFHGTEEELKQTKVTQPAVFLHAYVAYRCLATDKPDMVAGHSLGEFTALAANGCLTFEDALRLVSKRAHAMQRACELCESGMAVVLKFDDAVVEEVCATIHDEVVVPANYNSPQQLVISGSKRGLELAMEKLREAGAKRMMMLNVGGAFHSPLMQPAQDELAEAIRGNALPRTHLPHLPERHGYRLHGSRYHPAKPAVAADASGAVDTVRAADDCRRSRIVPRVRTRHHSMRTDPAH